MANPNGTSMIGGQVPVPPNPGVQVPALVGTKISKSKSKGRKGTRGKSFKQANGTRSGVMRSL